MKMSEFRRVGHWPTLICAFLYFDISFMVWMLVGALANSMVGEFDLTDTQKGFLVALPLLGGALLRPVFGLLTDHLGARRTGLLGLTLTLVPLLLAWLWADSFGKMLLVGLLLGVAGASFATALPLASRWYPPQYQGVAMGIAAAGNSGTALAAFFAPRLAEAISWHAVFGLAMIPIALVLLIFLVFAKDSPTQPPPQRLADYAGIIRQHDAWWFCLFYSITFGGFVGLASFLNIFFHDQYGLSKVQAGEFATLCIVAGSFLRPVGGYLSDQFGGIRLLIGLFVGVGLLMLDMATSPPLIWGTFLLFCAMGMLGLGNGAVFQLVPLRFSKEIGVVTGLVGAAGGIGGFFLPLLLTRFRDWTGSFGGGFLVISFVAFGSMAALVNVSRSWEGSFCRSRRPCLERRRI